MLGFGSDVKTYKEAKSDIEKAFKDTFNPEFINRLDSVVYFNTLNRDDAELITKINLQKLPVRVTKKLVSYVVEGAFSEEYGARNIKRFIRNNVTIKIADRILEKSKAKKYSPVFDKGKLVSVKDLA